MNDSGRNAKDFVSCQVPTTSLSQEFCLLLHACTVRRHCCDIILTDPVGAPHLSSALTLRLLMLYIYIYIYIYIYMTLAA